MGFKRKGRGGSGLSRHVKGQCTKGGKQGGRTPKKKAKHVDVSTAGKATHAVAGDSGKYYADCKEIHPHRRGLDDDVAEKLWDLTVKAVKI